MEGQGGFPAKVRDLMCYYEKREGWCSVRGEGVRCFAHGLNGGEVHSTDNVAHLSARRLGPTRKERRATRLLDVAARRDATDGCGPRCRTGKLRVFPSRGGLLIDC